MARPSTCRVLLVYPRFNPNSFWNYQATCEAVGARYSATPLGLITVAALLPAGWECRLVDRNVDELEESDFEWADVVMTGGMLPQQRDALELIRRAHAHGKPVVVGGPDATSSPHRYEEADFRVLGEAEEVIAEFLAAWRDGAERGTFEARQLPDVTRSPVPRFDLLKLERYMHVGMQVSRGCPFNCEFCNVIELNGRVPRLKGTEQVLRELEALYTLGYRGHVDFVDDNLIGNRKAIKPLLRELARWVKEHRYPFEFTTEASINLAADDELLGLLKQANFFAIFVGIETPDSETLKQSQKRQNVGRDVAECVKKMLRAGLFVNAGFIVGFDTERGSVAEGLTSCIEESAVPVAMVGLLYALPNTQLSRRLLAEGRLHADSDVQEQDDADQCTSGLNFETRRPREEVLRDYHTVLKNIYEPRAFFGRVKRMVRELDMKGHRLNLPPRLILRDLKSFGRISARLLRDPETRGPYLDALGDALRHNPLGAKATVSMAALYLHLKPFSRFMLERIGERVEAAARGEEVAELARPPEAPPSASA
jgi:radical SAM superfamily enzyme YgiQ (UPF0313 family)